MRVLQTIGFREGRNTPFYYRRNGVGTDIEPLKGDDNPPFNVSQACWEIVWTAIANAPNQIFQVTEGDGGATVPQNLYGIVRECLKAHSCRADDSAIAYVNAILLHEGTLQTYHGKAGDTYHRINFRRSR